MYEYLLILVCLFGIVLWLEKRYDVHLYDNRRERLLIAGTFFVIGVVWDTFAVSRGHWHFPHGKNLGIYIGLLPLEEYLFFLIIPFKIITVYKILHSKLRSRHKTRKRK